MQRCTTTRTNLEGISGRETYEAKFKKVGVNPRFPDRETILLVDVIKIDEDGSRHEMTDHCWISKSKRWNAKVPFFTDGQVVTFSAIVEEYFKEGTRAYFKDYTLGKIRNISV